MAIPNTTPTPNELYNGEMPKMGDTDLRIVLIVTRATLGWEINHETGMRKQEDWISYYQLKKRSGRGYTALAKSIDKCVKRGWIETRDEQGNLLDTKNKRIGKKIYYRLGKIFLDKVKSTSSESEEVKDKKEPTSSECEITESEITESEAYKRNPIQNKSITKPGNEVAGNDIKEIIEAFKCVNPSYEVLFKNKTERGATERLIKKYGKDKILQSVNVLPQIINQPYAPRITTPYLFEKKLGELKAFSNQEKSKGGRNKVAFH